MAKSRTDPAMEAVERMRAAEVRSRMATTREEKISAAIAKIRAFHDLGRHLPAKGAKGTYRGRIMEEEQRRLGISQDTLRKARVFAATYTATDLDDLCRQIEKVQSGHDTSIPVFDRTHVIRLLSIRQGKRKALQRECIRKGWSVSELDREIAKLIETRPTGGRRRRIGHDLTSFLTELEGMCESWRRWAKELSRDPEEVEEEHIFMADLPAHLRKQIKGATAQIWTLHQAVAKDLKRKEPNREMRNVLRSEEESKSGRGRKG